MSAFSATEHDEPNQPSRAAAGTTDGKKQSFGSWARSRPTYMSFAMFFMLFCGGLLTSGLGPALPIIEHQCNVYETLIHTHTLTDTLLSLPFCDHSTTSRASYVVTGRYIGYLAGSRSHTHPAFFSERDTHTCTQQLLVGRSTTGSAARVSSLAPSSLSAVQCSSPSRSSTTFAHTYMQSWGGGTFIRTYTHLCYFVHRFGC